MTPTPTPTPTPTQTPSPPSSSRGSQTYDRTVSNHSPRIFGPFAIDYPENSTDPVASFTVRDEDGDNVSWSLLGADWRLFSISDDGVLRFNSPPDYESPGGLRGNTYWVVIEATDDGKPVEYDVHNVYVTVTQVNELGEVTGDAEPLLPEGLHNVQYSVDDPENDQITWSLSGPDASTFTIDDNGKLTPGSTLDFETPSSADDSNRYRLTIMASDSRKPIQSRSMEVIVTVTNVNEAPSALSIPTIELMVGQSAFSLNLDLFFDDPDDDPITYALAGDGEVGVAEAPLNGRTLRITPISPGQSSFSIVATDPTGLSATNMAVVSVTGLAVAPVSPIATPVPIVTETPIAPPVTTAKIDVQDNQFWDLSEHRYSNLTQHGRGVSEINVVFSIRPVQEQARRINLPDLAKPPLTPILSVGQSAQQSTEQGPDAEALPEPHRGLGMLILIGLVALIATLLAGYTFYMVVVHRVSFPRRLH